MKAWGRLGRVLLVFSSVWKSWWNTIHEFWKWLLRGNNKKIRSVVFFPMFFKMPCMCDLLYSAGIHFICELLLLIQPFTVPVTGMDALTLNYWLSRFVQEVAKSSKDPYPPKTLNQIVCGIRRFMVEKNPAIEFNPWTLRQKVSSCHGSFSECGCGYYAGLFCWL